MSLIALCLGLSRPLYFARRLATPVQLSERALGINNINIINGEASRELITFEKLLKVKPYPSECPYDGLELFSSAEPLRLQPHPDRIVNAALHSTYRRQLANSGGDAVLEHVCDGETRLPWAQRRHKATQLHHSGESLAAGRRAHPRLEHSAMPALILPPPESDIGPQYDLPYRNNEFDAVLSHHCLPYTIAPLPLFAELHRVLKPSGKLCVTFQAPPPVGSSSRWAQHATADPLSASLAWLEAADAADLLYMVGSFFYYSGGWSTLDVSEVLPHSPACPAPLYCVSATKLTNREMMVIKTQRDPGRTRSPLPPPSPPSVASDQPQPTLPTPATAAGATPHGTAAPATVPPPPAVAPVAPPPAAAPTPRAPRVPGSPPPIVVAGPKGPAPPNGKDAVVGRRLQDAAAQRRTFDAARVRVQQQQQKQKQKQQAAPGAVPGAARGAARGAAASAAADGARDEEAVEGEDASSRVRRKILDTIKRGIADNSGRTDLADGERRMLEHMCAQPPADPRRHILPLP